MTAAKVKKRFEKLGIFQIVPQENLFTERADALKKTLTIVNPNYANIPTSSEYGSQDDSFGYSTQPGSI
ncbi:hypothetical protein [Brunnivagina elsteri]|uniref:Uncharacterized protein n=1 Tax=Brunnivagina elsteri CCALA 953 TaxID=987040 RepID=A0A2A2TQI2_9CYAN|nr:hypothetical protein [Calothrix elsteri]PAX60685.1 hypothetical protein CK510_00290 [Calothrix elsteri CCALA 953]